MLDKNKYEILIVTYSRGPTGKYEPNEYMVRSPEKADSIEALKRCKQELKKASGSDHLVSNVVLLRKIPLWERFYLWMKAKHEGVTKDEIDVK